MTRLLLTLRIHRFEALGIGLLAAAILIGSGGLWLRLLAFDLPASCFFNGPQFDQGCAARNAEVNDYMALAGDLGMYALIGIAFLPVLSGLILGIALVGKELERGTTTLAWSIAPSRRSWLLGRVLPIGLLVTGACLAAGFIANGLELVRNPTIDPARTFQHLGLRGVVVAAEGLGVFGVALAVGARLGRVLPALLLSGALVVGGFVGTAFLMDALLRTETVAVTVNEEWDSNVWMTGRVFGMGIRTPDGVLLSWDDAYQQYGEAIDPGMPGFEPGGFEQVFTVNPGELYPIVEWRMTVIFGAIGLAGIVLAFAIVERRRPT